MYFSPHQYQLDAIEFAINRGSCHLWLDPGLGKTAITLQVIRSLFHAGQIRKALVVAPLRPMSSVWPNEKEKWQQFNNLSLSVLYGKHRDKAALDDAVVHVTNFESVGWLSRKLMQHNVAWPYDLVVIDEISYLKNTRTQRFKTLLPLLLKAKRRIGLTGSPAPNSLLDIFGPCLAIDGGATFGRYITQFRTEYFMPTGYGGYTWVLQPMADKRIYEKLEGKALRISAEGNIDLPELTENRIYVDLPKEARKTYDAIEDKLMADVANGTVTALNAAVAIGKCQQIANGAVYLDGNDKKWDVLHDAKLQAVKDLVDEMAGQPVIIAYTFRHDLARLQEAFPSAKHIGSGIKEQDLQATIDEWNAGRVEVLLCHPQSAGHGLNLQGAGHAVVWFSNTWSLELFEQMNRRLYRQGQVNHIVVHQVIARKTVDEAIVRALDKKDKTQTGLLNAIADYASKKYV